MEKTRLGISVGLLGAAVYLIGLFGGYVAAILMVGYVLLCEENGWLKQSAVKAISLMVLFSLINILVNLIPSAVSCIVYLISMFGGSVILGVFSSFINVVTGVIGIIEKLLFIGLGVMALKQGTIPIPVIDKMISKYME